jgi:SPP1 gp7 family putative phage head morphogenesis protein
VTLNRLLTRDAARHRTGFDPRKARRAEARYRRQLQKVARNISDLIKTFKQGDKRQADKITAALRSYSNVVRPWAEAAGEKMVAEVNAMDAKAWREHSAEMGRALKDELRNAPTGIVMRKRVAEQVELITSLPLQAAERVQKLAQEALVTGDREGKVYASIMRTGEVTEARARTIARTEVGRAQSELTQARAEFVGSTGYIWRTSRDVDVRDSHKKMEGKFVAWASPPTLDGLRGHAGTLPNCRCYAEVVVPESDE